MSKLHTAGRLLAVLLLLAPALARADYRPFDVNKKNAVPLVSPGDVTRVGEIVVMVGDAEILGDMGGGLYGIEADHLANIVSRFYLHFPDEFDAITIFTAFPDQLNPTAYAICQEPGVTGLGTGGGGCPGGSPRLLSVTNMNDTDNYGPMDAGDALWVKVMAEEFGHSWLTFFQFIDDGLAAPSMELLGRQQAHWAANVHAGGSFMDGVSWQDNGDGTFTVIDINKRYPPIDLYAMGIVPPEEVEPLFIIRDAALVPSGEPLDLEVGMHTQLGPGSVVSGTRHDLTLDDIIAAVGERTPRWDASPEEFRQAIVLVTPPGIGVAQVEERIAKLELGRITWEEAFAAQTTNRGYVCTNVSAPCPRAAAKVIAATIAEDPDRSDGDGVIEPYERASVTATLWNTGGADATEVVGSLVSAAPGVILPEPEALPVIPMNEQIQASQILQIEGEACGEEIEVEFVATIESRSWKAPVTFRPGVLEGPVEPFTTDAGWVADAAGSDTAATGGWTWGVPEKIDFFGRITQPDGGHGGATDPAWMTDTDGGALGEWRTSEIAGGETTLTSAAYDLVDAVEPTLRYWVWYVALDRTSTSITPAPEPHLVVQASTDGATWVDIDSVGGDPLRWVRREAAIPPELAAAGPVQVRFRAFDDVDIDRLVEVGVDDVQIVSLSRACIEGPPDEGGGCGCRTTPGRTGGRAGALALLLVGGLLIICLRPRSRWMA